MNEKEKNSAVLLDLGGVVFDKNPDPNSSYKEIMNLFNGKYIEETAKYFNIEDELEKIKQRAEYQKKNSVAAAYYAGECLLEKLKEMKVFDQTDLISARVDAVRMRDEKIISTIKEQFPYINIGIATQDGQIIHEVIKHYFPEIAEKLQIVTTDSDINTNKITSDFYYNAASRLYIPTSNMSLVDDSKANIDGIKNAGGTGSVFNPNDENANLSDTVLDTIEESLRR